MTDTTLSPSTPVASRNLPAPIGFGTRGLQLTSIDDMFRYSKFVVASGLAPKSFRTPEQVTVAIQTGAELGFGPMHSLWAIPVINGRPTLMVEPAMALVLASNLCSARTDRFEGEGAKRTCIVALARRGGALAVERKFSIEEAKRAGLESRDVWRGYPDRMLYARALGYALHDLFPDVLRGLRVSETLDEFSGSYSPMQGRVVVDRGEQGPDPVLAQLESGSVATFESHIEAEPVAAFVEGDSNAS